MAALYSPHASKRGLNSGRGAFLGAQVSRVSEGENGCFFFSIEPCSERWVRCVACRYSGNAIMFVSSPTMFDKVDAIAHARRHTGERRIDNVFCVRRLHRS